MHRAKTQRNKKIIIDLLLIVLLNASLWLFFRENNLLAELLEYADTHKAYRLHEFIPLIVTLLLSALYFSIRRWREGLLLLASAERRGASDALTKLYNRRAFEAELSSEWQRFIRYRKTFCLIMLDIDDFKMINEIFGRREGDRILVETAGKIVSNTRKIDFCARWSAAKFLILCPASELMQTNTLAERLRTDIYSLLKDGVELSASLGVTQVDATTPFDELIINVETLLYKAKQEGGNCVHSN